MFSVNIHDFKIVLFTLYQWLRGGNSGLLNCCSWWNWLVGYGNVTGMLSSWYWLTEQ